MQEKEGRDFHGGETKTVRRVLKFKNITGKAEKL